MPIQNIKSTPISNSNGQCSVIIIGSSNRVCTNLSENDCRIGGEIGSATFCPTNCYNGSCVTSNITTGCCNYRAGTFSNVLLCCVNSLYEII